MFFSFFALTYNVSERQRQLTPHLPTLTRPGPRPTSRHVALRRCPTPSPKQLTLLMNVSFPYRHSRIRLLTSSFTVFQMYSHLDEEHDILYVLCRQAMQEALPRDVIKPSLLWDNADTALVVIGILLVVTLILSLFLSLFFDGLYVAFAAPTVWMTVLYIVRTPRRRREKEEKRRQRLAKEKVDMLEDAKRTCKAKLDDVTAKIKNRRYD